METPSVNLMEVLLCSNTANLRCYIKNNDAFSKKKRQKKIFKVIKVDTRTTETLRRTFLVVSVRRTRAPSC